MKKLLLVTALLALGATASAKYINNGPANYGSPAYRPFIEDITTNDNEFNTDLVRRFRQKGNGWRDREVMRVKLVVHEKVRIKPEYRMIKGKGVKGDKLSFGDINFKVKGTMPVDVKFKFKGDLFENTTMLKKATVKKPNGAIETVLGPSDIDLSMPLSFAKSEKMLEMDLYFKLNEVGHHYGRVIAIAKYQ